VLPPRSPAAWSPPASLLGLRGLTGRTLADSYASRRRLLAGRPVVVLRAAAGRRRAGGLAVAASRARIAGRKRAEVRGACSAPVDGAAVTSFSRRRLAFITGGARAPGRPPDLSRRYAELLTENLGQPGSAS
jgi:hypothetical protein